MLRKVGGFFAGYVCLCSTVLLCTAGVGLMAGGEESPGVMFALIIFFGVISWGSFKLTKTLFSAPKPEGYVEPVELTDEQRILELAMASDGTLTIAEIAAHTPLSVADAKSGVEALTREGVASVEFDEKQDVYYRFPGLE